MYTIQHGSTPVAMMINCACQFITMILSCPAFINERVQIRIWDSLNGYFGIHRGIQFKILIVLSICIHKLFSNPASHVLSISYRLVMCI